MCSRFNSYIVAPYSSVFVIVVSNVYDLLVGYWKVFKMLLSSGWCGCNGGILQSLESVYMVFIGGKWDPRVLVLALKKTT